MSKISIVGCGYVGSTAAYALFIRELADEIALIDLCKDKVEGEAMDLEHGLFFKPGTRVIYGESYELCKDSDIIIITAGKAQEKGQTRLDLIQDNTKIFRQMIPEIAKHAPNAILMVVTNPVDIMTYVTLKASGFPKERVFGTGTTLDTARFRYYLSKIFDMSPESIHAYILGEHGDTEFPVWSHANISGLNLRNFEEWDEERMQKAFEQTKQAAYEVINKKGATYYAIGLVITDLCEAILRDSNRVYPVSVYLENYYDEGDLCISTPCVVGKKGIERVIQLPLTEEEQEHLHKSAQTLKKNLEEIK